MFQGLHTNSFHMGADAEKFGNYCGFKHRKIPKTRLLLDRANRFFFPVWVKHKEIVPEIYHPTYYDCINASSSRGCRKVITVFDLIHARMDCGNSRRHPTTDMIRRAADEADRIIAISENTKKDIMEFLHVPESRIEVIYLGGDHIIRTSGVSNSGKIAGSLLRGLDRPFVLYVGDRKGYKGYKNFSTLLKAFSAWNTNREFLLVCAGGGAKWSDEHLRMIAQHGAHERLRLFPFVSDEELRELYTRAYCFVIPSLYEGFGIPPVEAMSCGAPVLAARSSSITEVVGNAGLYFDPLCVEELRMLFDRLAGDEGLRSALRSKGLERSRLFTWEMTARKTFELYRSVVNTS